MKEFFIADLHLGHKNILSYDDRPFLTIEEHDEELIKRWNSAVSNDDRAYVLGDICWYKPDKAASVLMRLNGEKRLIYGNHDAKYLTDRGFRSQFAEIGGYKERRLQDGKMLVLCHYPIPCFNGHYRGGYHLYGHVHNSFEWHMMEHVRKEMTALYQQPCNMFNVGCMMPEMDYTPRTLDEILSLYKSKFERECSDGNLAEQK